MKLKIGMRVYVSEDIDPYLDTGRYRGVGGTVHSKSKYERQWWVEMDDRLIFRKGRYKEDTPNFFDDVEPCLNYQIWHEEDLKLELQHRREEKRRKLLLEPQKI